MTDNERLLLLDLAVAVYAALDGVEYTGLREAIRERANSIAAAQPPKHPIYDR